MAASGTQDSCCLGAGLLGECGAVLTLLLP